MDEIKQHWENLPESKYELATHDIESVDYETCANPNYVEWLESKLEELSTELDEYKLLLKEERLIYSNDKEEIKRLKAENEAIKEGLANCWNCGHYNNGCSGTGTTEKVCFEWSKYDSP